MHRTLHRICRRAALACCALLTALALPALGADAFPDKPVKLVVAYAAGGGTDEVARLIAPRLSAVLGQPVVIENRGGAGGTIGVATNAVLADQAHMILSGTTGVAFVRAGKLRALGTTGSKRSAALPDVPTLAEQGLDNFFMGNSWVGVFAPAGTPDGIANQLSAALDKALDDEALRKHMQELNFEVVNQPPAAMARTIADEIPRYARFIREAGIKFD